MIENAIKYVKQEVIDDLSDEKMQKRLWKEGSFEQGI